MTKSQILVAVAAAAFATGAPALAQVALGGQGGVNVGGAVGVGLPRLETPRIDTDTRVGVDVRTDARANSQGPAHANARARTRADANSVLSADLLPPNLAGLDTGLAVFNETGVRIGTVSRIVADANGRVRTVLVARDGRRGAVRLDPDTLSVSGGVVTTTAARFNADAD